MAIAFFYASNVEISVGENDGCNTLGTPAPFNRRRVLFFQVIFLDKHTGSSGARQRHKSSGNAWGKTNAAECIP